MMKSLSALNSPGGRRVVAVIAVSRTGVGLRGAKARRHRHSKGTEPATYGLPRGATSLPCEVAQGKGAYLEAPFPSFRLSPLQATDPSSAAVRAAALRSWKVFAK